jgi:hypothetical protein
MQPFSAVSVSLLAPREIVFSARCGARVSGERNYRAAIVQTPHWPERRLW